MANLFRLQLVLMLCKCVWLSESSSSDGDDSFDGTLTSTLSSDEPATGRKGYVFRDTRPSEHGFEIKWDPSGYIFHCLAMGRIGNQMEHFLGSLAFAKKVNRTLVLPPLRTYRNVRFTEVFKFEPLLEYHRVILAEDFMDHLAPTYWPPEKRIGYCVHIPKSNFECTLKDGFPLKPFWDDLGVEFAHYDWVEYSYQQPEKFKNRYPGDKYPVMALRGAPASYPMQPENWPLQKYLKFSKRIVDEAQRYIDQNFKDRPFVGIHLRNGPDWENACNIDFRNNQYMASPQCLHGTKDQLTKEMCYPSKEKVLRLTKEVLTSTGAKVLFIATDRYPMIEEFTNKLKELEVHIFHMDPHLPQIDQAILIQADHFIGNCVSSFTSFVTRARLIENKPTSFWAYSREK